MIRHRKRFVTWKRIRYLSLSVLCASSLTCSEGGSLTEAPADSTPPGSSVVFAGAGDISDCGNDNDEATAKLLDGISGTVFTLGDNVYSGGSPAEFSQCYDPTWGRHKARTMPAPGNHDYHISGAAGYLVTSARRPGRLVRATSVSTWATGTSSRSIARSA